MQRSTDHILTSHVGSLPRPAELLAKYKAGADEDELADDLRLAVADVVKRQQGAGVDIVNDGEYGKPMSDAVDYGAWQEYAYGRVDGYEVRAAQLSDFGVSRDFVEFSDYYGTAEAAVASDPDAPVPIGVNVGPVSYSRHDLIARDIGNLKAAVGDKADAFLSSMGSGAEAFQLPSEHYTTGEEEMVAMAEAMRDEYKAITDAGLIVQIDDPWMVDQFGVKYSHDWDVAGYRKWAERHVEIINHSLEGIASEQIRFHICWGSWKGPHSSDLPLSDVVDLALKVNADLYSVEAANPMHEHEWHVRKDTKLPENKIIMPGVVTHKTNVLEHPDVVADRIVRYAELVGRENVIAGTDCGMGGRIHPDIAWAKLKALVDGAEIASKRLWS